MKKIGVVGAGTMGHGIAQVAAMAGYEVWLTDRQEDFVPVSYTNLTAADE